MTESTKINPQEFGFERSPFTNVATAESAKIWAGMEDTKEFLQDVIDSVRPDDIGEREFVIIHGSYGGGKTHAFQYFKNQVEKSGRGFAFFASRVRIDDKASFSELAKTIVSEHRAMLPDLVSHVQRAVERAVYETREESGDTADQAARQKRAINKLVDNDCRQLVEDFVFRGSADADKLVELVIGGKQSDHTAVSRFSALLGAMTMPIGDCPAKFDAVYLFLDEVESILDIGYKWVFSFFSALRGLIDSTAGYHCAIVMAFSTDAARLEAELSDFLRQRLTRALFEMRELEDDEGKNFIKEFLDAHRASPADAGEEFAPFSEGVIDEILERHNEVVPRKLILDMTRVFERAVRRGGIQPGEEIPTQMAKDILAKMPPL